MQRLKSSFICKISRFSITRPVIKYTQFNFYSFRLCFHSITRFVRFDCGLVCNIVDSRFSQKFHCDTSNENRVSTESQEDKNISIRITRTKEKNLAIQRKRKKLLAFTSKFPSMKWNAKEKVNESSRYNVWINVMTRLNVGNDLFVFFSLKTDDVYILPHPPQKKKKKEKKTMISDIHIY